MSKPASLVRYAVITEKNPREIVMLRGTGCVWKRCRFCDYHLDKSTDQQANFLLNRKQLEQVTGQYQKLEVINSGSFVDLDEATIALIEQTCLNRHIPEVHFECHWMHRDAISAFRQRFFEKGIILKLKIGVETFDYLFRESYLMKGIDTGRPEDIAAYFDEVCLLFGIPGQTLESMELDIKTGLTHFERVCVNIMTENRMPIKPDPRVISVFQQKLYSKYIGNERIDILIDNTDFGVGGTNNHV